MCEICLAVALTTRAGPTNRPKPAPRPGPVIHGHCGRVLRVLAFSMPAMGVLCHAKPSGSVSSACRTLGWCNSLAGLVAALYVHIQRRCSNAPPEVGRGATATNNQAFCSTPCMANIRPTMIELLSAWNSHEYATFFPDITYTSVRTMLSGRYVKKSCHW